MEGFVWFGLGLHACLINDKREKEKKYLMTASIFVGSMYNHPLVFESSKHQVKLNGDWAWIGQNRDPVVGPG
jgi:hypothetical protein